MFIFIFLVYQREVASHSCHCPGSAYTVIQIKGLNVNFFFIPDHEKGGTITFGDFELKVGAKEGTVNFEAATCVLVSAAMPNALLEIMLPLSNRFLAQENTNQHYHILVRKELCRDQSTLRSSVWGEKQFFGESEDFAGDWET